jgi:hypothetical protein
MMESAEHQNVFCHYTHLQMRCLPLLHVVLLTESLIDDITMLNAALTVVDQNRVPQRVTEVRSRSTEPLPQSGLRNPEIQCRCGK